MVSKSIIAVFAVFMGFSSLSTASAAYYLDQTGRAIYYDTYVVPGGQFYPPYPQYGYNQYGSYTVAYGGSNIYGASSYGSFYGNRQPVIFSTPVREAVAGEAYVAGINASDPDHDPLFYQLVSGPSGMYINSSTGLLRWDNTSGKGGQTHTVTVSVTDGRSAPVTQTYQLIVKGGRTTTVTSGGSQTTTGSTGSDTGTASVWGNLFGKKTAKQLAISNVNVISGPKTIGDSQDRNCEVYVSWDTSIAAAGGVLYGTTSQQKDAEYVYDQTAPEGNSYAKQHQVKLGCLGNESTVFFRVFAVSADAQRVVSDEYTIFPVTIRTQIPGTASTLGSISSGTDGSSIWSLFAGILFNPIVLIVLAIAIVWFVGLNALRYFNSKAARIKKEQEAAAHAPTHVATAAHGASPEIPMLQVPHH